MGLVFSCRLGVAREGVSCVVDYDIKMEVFAKVLSSCSESCVDVTGGSHVQGELKDVGIVVWEIGEA